MSNKIATLAKDLRRTLTATSGTVKAKLVLTRTDGTGIEIDKLAKHLDRYLSQAAIVKMGKLKKKGDSVTVDLK